MNTDEYLTIREALTNEQFEIIDSENPYNYLDALVLSNFIYLPIGSIDIPTYKGKKYQMDIKGYTIENIVSQIDLNIGLFNERFYDNSEQTGEKGAERQNFYDFFKSLETNPRYKDLKVIDFVCGLSSFDDIYQYCCFLVEIKENEEYVLVCRGTDRTMEGWYEDSKIIYEITTGQKKTLDFLNQTLEKYKGIIHLTGHSKGGCNAYYSLIKANPINLLRLDLCIFDALFFNHEFAEDNKEHMEFIRSLNITSFYNIEKSFIGEVLFGLDYSVNENNLKYIKSTSLVPFLEHCLYSYHVCEGDFEYVKLDEQSKLVNDTFKDMILNDKERVEIFFECIFSILGKETINSVLNSHLTNKEKLILILENFYNTNTDDLLIMYKVINELYNEIDTIITLGEEGDLEALFDNSIEHESDEGEKHFKKNINEFLLNKLNLESVEEIEKFKKNITVILKLINSKDNNKNKENSFFNGTLNLFANRKKYTQVRK